MAVFSIRVVLHVQEIGGVLELKVFPQILAACMKQKVACTLALVQLE